MRTAVRRDDDEIPTADLPSEPPVTTGRFRPTREEMEERARQAFVWRHAKRLSYEQVIQAFAYKGIKVSRSQVQEYIRLHIEYERKALSKRGFDARAEVAKLILQFDDVYAESIRDSQRPGVSTAEKAIHRKTALDALDRKLRLWQDVKLIDHTVGTLLFGRAEEGSVVEKIPSGLELRRWFENLDVVEGEVLSPAERAIRYGEHAALPARADADAHPEPAQQPRTRRTG